MCLVSARAPCMSVISGRSGLVEFYTNAYFNITCNETESGTGCVARHPLQLTTQHNKHTHRRGTINGNYNCVIFRFICLRCRCNSTLLPDFSTSRRRRCRRHANVTTSASHSDIDDTLLSPLIRCPVKTFRNTRDVTPVT